MKKVFRIIICMLTVAALFAACGKNNSVETYESIVETSAENSSIVEKKLTADELEVLKKAGVIAGVEDYILVKGTDADFLELTTINKDLVSDLVIDDSKVRANVPGEYKVLYTVTFDMKKVAEFESKKKISLGLDKDCDLLVATITTKVEVLSEKDAAAVASDDTRKIISKDTINDIVNNNNSEVGSDAVSAKEVVKEAAYEAGTQQKDGSVKEPETSSKKDTENNTNTNTNQRETTAAASVGQQETKSVAPTTQHSHSYSSKVEKEATCSAEGRIKYTCSCGATYTEAIPALAHNWNDGAVTLEPTESTMGTYTYTCYNCGKTRTENIPVLQHEYVMTDSNYQPNSNNYETYTCVHCGDTYTNDLGWKPCYHVDSCEWHTTGRVVCNACHQTFENKEAFNTHLVAASAAELPLLMEDINWSNEFGNIHSGGFTWEQVCECMACGEILAYDPEWGIR